MHDTDTEAQSASGPYLAFTFIIGIGLVVALAYAGYAALPMIPVVLAGAAAQTAFRVIKRTWKRSLTQDTEDTSDRQPSTAEGMKALVMVFVAMIAVSLLWYWIGTLLR